MVGLVAGALAVSLSVAFGSVWGADPGSALLAAPVPEWDAAFTRSAGWTGGDVAATVDLGDGRTLWLFGDTCIGKVADGRHAPGWCMVNNSIALHRSPGGSAHRPPAPATIDFHWGPNDDQARPTAWIVPVPPGPGDDPGQSHGRRTAGWYWPTGGGAVVPGPHGKPRLVIFLFHVGKREGATGVWAFKSVGGALATIDHVDQTIDKWVPRQYPIPYTIAADAAKADRNLRETSWGMAAHWEGPGREGGPGFVYVYGIRDQSPLNRQLVLARAPADSVHQFGTWRFYAGKGKWSAQPEALVPVAENLVSELSIEEFHGDGRATWIMVHSEPLLGPRIFVRTAARPEGPWGRPVPVYTAPEVARDRTYFAYAAKGHLHLSRPGELLITYAVNSHDFASMAKDAGIYRPRFVSVRLDRVLPPGKGPP